jgi:hypothetical protein
VAVDFSTGGSTYFTKPPRTIITYDTVSGCFPTRNAGTAIASTSVVLTAAASLVVEGKLIRQQGCSGQRDGNVSSRCDLSLYVSTGQVCRTLDWNDGIANDWNQHCVCWMGTLAAGTHSIYMYSDNCHDCFGCTSPWGHLQVLIFE